jgi:hypothetical protein
MLTVFGSGAGAVIFAAPFGDGLPVLGRGAVLFVAAFGGGGGAVKLPAALGAGGARAAAAGFGGCFPSSALGFAALPPSVKRSDSISSRFRLTSCGTLVAKVLVLLGRR